MAEPHAPQVPHDAHEHKDGCGHKPREHGDHIDYDHGGHWHAKHEDHWDEHVLADEEQPLQKPTWGWLLRNWPQVARIAGIAAGAVAATWFLLWLIFPDMPRLDANSSVEQRSASVGAFLVLGGTALTVVAFVPALVLTILSSFDLRSETRDRVQKDDLGGTLKAFIAAIPDLIKAPAGFGVALVLLGVILMSTTALADEPDPSPTPTPSTPADPASDPPPSVPATGPTPVAPSPSE